MITRRRWLMDEWRDAFLMEARLRHLPGARIGEALAEIETHCADSGMTPDEAFGDPIQYARTIAAGHPRSRGLLWKATAQALGTLAGILCLLDGVSGVEHATRATVTVGQVVSVPAGAAAVVAIIALVFRSSRARAATLWLVLAVNAGVATTVIPQLVWKGAALHAPAWAVLSTGLLLLALTWWPMASGRMMADRVLDPRTGTDALPLPAPALFLARWGLPLALLAIVILTLFLPGPH